jgi:hypothetical protein
MLGQMKRWLAALVIAACGRDASPPPASAPPRGAEPGEMADDPEDPNDTLPVVTAAATAASPREALLAEVRRELTAMTERRYAHHTHVDEATGVFDFDCSGFVGYALSRAAPAAFQTIVDATRRRPLAKHFEGFFAAPRAPWTAVARVADLVPGDLIAWLEPPVKRSRNTGHVMIVAAPPHAGERAGELVVAVIDSSHSGHGPSDTRLRDHRDGLGSGPLVLITDGAGRPVGYRWSTSRRSVAYATQIALGHLP